ncbi:hypothetical protein Tco_1107761 [Tanacetum coccineum]
MLADDTTKAIKANKRDLRSQHQTGGSSEGSSSKLEVPDEPKGKSRDTSEGAGSKLEVLDVSKAKSSDQESENVEFRRISLTGFCSCPIRSHYQSVSKQTTRLGDIDLLLVTFNSELKISLLNNQASGEHSQCYCEVRNIIAQEICESVLKNKEKHVLDVIDTKT